MMSMLRSHFLSWVCLVAPISERDWAGKHSSQWKKYIFIEQTTGFRAFGASGSDGRDLKQACVSKYF